MSLYDDWTYVFVNGITIGHGDGSFLMDVISNIVSLLPNPQSKVYKDRGKPYLAILSGEADMGAMITITFEPSQLLPLRIRMSEPNREVFDERYDIEKFRSNKAYLLELVPIYVDLIMDKKISRRAAQLRTQSSWSSLLTSAKNAGKV